MKPCDTVIEYLAGILDKWDDIYLKHGVQYVSLAQCTNQREIIKFLRSRLKDLDTHFASKEGALDAAVADAE